MMGGPDPDLCAPAYTAHIGTNPQMTLAHHQDSRKPFTPGFRIFVTRLKKRSPTIRRLQSGSCCGGTHTGEFMGIPPTHKSFEAGAVVILTIEKDKVVALRGQFDQLGMLRQLGVVP
jgi:hypothetical protein